jgi:cyclopropane-fatty-acyl-phospholipid synthase
MVLHHGAAHATGLSLSQAQTDWILARTDPRINVRIESWTDHQPSHVYDAILSIEAMEAFVKPGLTRTARTSVYRSLFERCHAWLKPGGMLVLQTIAYGNSGPEDLDAFIASDIFPESDLPRLGELADAYDRRFEMCRLVNDRDQYLLTIRAWLTGLRQHRTALVAMVGEPIVQRYEQYLKLCTYLFASGSCDLYRMALRRIDFPREAGHQPPQRPLSQ